MDPITIAMLGMGALNMIQGANKEKRQTELAAATQRYSPWTKLQAQPIESADPVGNLAQAGGAALGHEQAKEASGSRDELRRAQIAALNRSNGGMFGGIGGGPTKAAAQANQMQSPFRPIPMSEQDYWTNQY